ncbi:nucleolar MIF4G domain-containing protein 1 homolog [Pieris brassicae]|uniref:nucleolar MIF4G domain-containing protein 1 homolog n=1 Tax=Pieris brassicae TaxID=7116 RepID=UPI001E660117|nr:nucleolar MIF4G domain-containing protein 1 homolog [Pieris brassicae]
MKKSNPKPRSSLVNSRKAIRKEKRQLKKAHRKEHYLKKKLEPSFSPGKFVKRPDDSSASDVKVKKKIQKPMIHDILDKERKKEIKETEKLKSQMENQRKNMFLKANEDEEKVIKKLEKQLGLNKSKNKNNYFADDGLDYLLEICDRTTSEQIVAAEKHLADVGNDSDFEEDLAVVTGKNLKKDAKKKHLKVVSDHSESDVMDVDDDSEEELENSDINIKEKSSTDEESPENDGESLETDENDEVMESDDPEGDLSNEDEDTGLSDEESDNDTDRKNTKLAGIKSNTVKSKQRVVAEDDISKVFSDDEVSHLSGDDSEIENNIEEVDSKSKEKPDVWEDIYGRKRDKEGNIIKEEKGVYIPPHLRNKDSGSEKDLAQLKRQVKSVLNKLAGTNLHWASTSIENLYLSNSRNSVNTALTQLWLDVTVSVALTPDRMVAEHAALVSVLHANVGSEIGAHFLEELSKKFDFMMMDPQPVEDKRLDNLVSCLAHLYSFKIYHASLLYDILARLVEDLSEKNIDCVLTALRCVGGVLRKEEPLALKNFIQDTQAKVARMNEKASTGSRIKFLLEVLLAVKNNNLTKIPNYDPSNVEHLKKMCRAIVRKGNYATPLNIRLEDLLRAHERGKWWVVGSAWEGNRPQEEKKTVTNFDQKLLKLAREQRMNTDVRRSIFCVIMSAQDYMDAFEKLQHLGLKGQQEREIVHVLLACCLQEKNYNPYYAVLGQKLCDTDRKYQLSIQYSVWDKIKELDSLSKQSMGNLAQFLIHLIMEKGLALSVLKIIEFSDLNKQSVKFMRQILLAIIMNADLQASLETFHRIAKSPKLHMFRESLRLFIQHFLIKNAGKKSGILSEDEMATLKERSVEVEKILTAYENKLRL